MLQTPYLIQRVIHRKEPRGKTIDGIFQMDYMGSAEFEFGALPKSLKEICYNYMDYTSAKVNSIKSNKGKILYLFSKLDEQEKEQYIEYIKQMIDGKIRLKEGTQIEYHMEGKKFSYVPSTLPDVWWDIDNHLMFTFGSDNLRRLLVAIENTIQKKIDEKVEGWYKK